MCFLFFKRNDPAFLWMEEGDVVERFSGGERFLGGRAEIGNSSVFFSYLKQRARWVPQVRGWGCFSKTKRLRVAQYVLDVVGFAGGKFVTKGMGLPKTVRRANNLSFVAARSK